MPDTIRIGVLYSTTGPYGAMGRDAREGAQFALSHGQALGPSRVEPVFIDPHADLAAYLAGARRLIDAGCRHIVGTITSAARKEVIPLVEKHDGLLWYMCPYEGFEANENVIYLGGCPNQHLIPLFDYLLPRHGARPYLVGANYVWGWEMNRLARELTADAGGTVLGERYLPFEETAVDRLVADIADKRPSFVLNNLVGPSSYAFLAAMRALGERDAAFLPGNCPVVSCDLQECELSGMAPGVATGQLCAASYFDSVAGAANTAFKRRVQVWRGDERKVSSMFAGAYAAVTLCLSAIEAARSEAPSRVRQALLGARWTTPLGELDIDASSNHAALPFHLGRVNEDGGFDVLTSRPALAADPYLVHAGRRPAPRLRLVS